MSEIIIETTSDEVCYDKLIEEVNKSVPDSVQKLLKRPRVRQELLDRCGNDAFLIPDKLKFPIVRPDDNSCKPCCQLLLAAYLRARQWHKKRPEYTKIAEKAKELYSKNKCDIRIGVKMEEDISHGQILDLDTVLEMLDGGLEAQNTSSLVDIVKQVVSSTLEMPT